MLGLVAIFLLRRFGARLDRITITELKNDVYYALISLRVDGALQEIDARPSDALAIAVRTDTPLFVARHLLSAEALPDDWESPEPDAPEEPDEQKHGA